MALDPTTNVGRLRLRVADIKDIPLLPDSVYQSTLDDTSNNLPEAARICANYILGMLSMRSHKKMAQMEIWADEYPRYKDFLLLTLTNPAFLDYTAIPFLVNGNTSPIKTFAEEWNCVWGTRTVDERLQDITGYNDTRWGDV